MTQDENSKSLSLKPEREIGQYRLVSRLGAGGMGEVWLARDTKLERDVALKFPLREAFAGTKAYDQMLSEARSVAALNHPNIVTVHEVGEYADQPFIAMAYVAGQTLQELMTRQKIPLRMTLSLGIQIADALAAAHAGGITHRDLKPGNVIVDKTYNCHVVDFGLALSRRQHTGDDDKTVDVGLPAQVRAGTVRYMAPEQVTDADSGPQVDIFALGIILYELAVGDHPIAGQSSREWLRYLVSDTPISVPTDLDAMPYDLTRIIRRCLEKDPEYRFQTAKDVRNELRDLQRVLDTSEAYFPATAPAAGLSGDLAMQEHRFPITAEMVRQLDVQSPKMIGDSLDYLDNGRFSETLVIYLHAWGLDFRQCVDFLQALPYRGIAPTLYGFSEHAATRLPLRLGDHSVLLRQLFQHVENQIRPERVIMAGHSSGADHILHLATSEAGFGIDVDGILVLGCNTSLSTCFLSKRFAELEQGDPASLLGEIMQIGNTAKSLTEWLKLHEYLVTVFSKFGKDADPLRAYAADIVAPFEAHDWRQFAAWYRETTARYDRVRFVYDAEEHEAMQHVLMEHLKSNVLGDHFSERTILREDVSHVELANAEVLLKHTRQLADELQGN